MQQAFKEVKERNNKSAKAMGFIFAATIALIGWGFYSSSLPAFLLAGFFTFTLLAETRVYKISIQQEKSIEKQKEKLSQLTSEKLNNKTDQIS